MSPGAAVGLGLREVRRIAVAGDNHMSGIEGDEDVGVRGCIV